MARKRKKDATAPAAIGMDEDYRAEHDAHALMHAEEVRADRGRHKAAQKHLQKKAVQVARALGKGAGRSKGSRRKRLENVQL